MSRLLSGQSVLGRITGTIFVNESIFSAAYIAAITLLSVNATVLGGSEVLAGVPLTVALIGRTLIAYPIGWLMDRRGRRVGAVIGYLLGAIGLAIGALAMIKASFLLLCLGTGLAGMANGISQQERFIASEIWPQVRRARVIGLIVFAGTAGAIGGPLLVPPTLSLATQFGLPANAGPYLFGAAIVLIPAMLAFLLLRPDPMELSLIADEADRETDRSVEIVANRSLRTVFASPFVQLAVASMVVGQLVMTMIMVITPVHMTHEHHSTGEISLVYMAHTLGMFGFAALTGWLIDRLGMRPMMVYGAVLLVAASVMAPVAANVLTLSIALFLLGLGWNFCFVAGSTMLSGQLQYGERGRVQGTNDMLVALASGTGSLVTGAIFASSRMVGIGTSGLAITLIFLVGATWLSRRQRAAVPG